MNRLRMFLMGALTTCCIAMLPAAAHANPLGGSLFFANNGGTLSGHFDFDPLAADPLHAIVSWELTSTTTAFGTHVYSSAATGVGASAIVDHNTDNDQIFAFFQVFQDGAVSSTFELDLVLGCGGVANCFTNAAEGTTFQLIGQHTCAVGPHCVSSGEQRPLGSGIFLSSGFLNVSDPPGTLNFYVASSIEPGFTLYNPGGSGGDDEHVPEPSSLMMMGTAAIGLVGRIARRRRSK